MIVLGDHDNRTKDQLARCANAVPGTRSVLCADGHLGYSMPIGGVVAYPGHVSPSGVGYDIACGNMAVQTNLQARDLRGHWSHLADEIQRRISFGVGRNNNEPADSPVIEEISKAPVSEQRSLVQMAANQLGTVGSGNHYVDVFEDLADSSVWVGVHFGSRGFGHKTATGFLNVAAGRGFYEGGANDSMDAPPTLLAVNSSLGEAYIVAMQLAGRYAYAGREAVVQKVLDILEARAIWTVHNHHNFAWKETHFGDTYWVVRKGATPAFPGQYGFVGGSMGDDSVILRGVDSDVSASLLYSTVHGAGRVMSRTQAAGKVVRQKAHWSCQNRDCDWKAPIFLTQPPACPLCGATTRRLRSLQLGRAGGLIDFEAEKLKLQDQQIVLRGAGADEAPPAYRRLSSVLAAHEGTISVERMLTPRIVVMAGENVVDPYKD